MQLPDDLPHASQDSFLPTPFTRAIIDFAVHVGSEKVWRCGGTIH